MPAEISIFLSLVWQYFWQFLKSWYWLILVIILWEKFKYFWLWWRGENFYKPKQKPIWWEIKLPRDILKPISAMEMVFDSIHKAFWEPAYFWEKWWQGKGDVYDFQFELVSDGGEIHFYVRCYYAYKMDLFKTAIYSQYPEAEIKEVEDYSRAIPADLPNKDWDIRAVDFTLARPDPYPIKTYPEFEKEAELITEEKKRVDPMAALLEGMAMLKPGEKIWLQIKPFPIGGKYAERYRKWGGEIKDKIAQRKVEKPKSTLGALSEAISSLITGKSKGKEEPGKIELVAPELRMTPREREICAAIERKISKELFMVSTIRFFYIAKRELYYHHRWRMILDFIGNFCVDDMNSLKLITHTYTKIINPPPLNLFDKRRLYVRKRRIIRLWQNRYEPLYPFAETFPFGGGWDYKWGYFVLNSEELATVFHFPSRKVAPAPGVARVEAKKAEAPPEVPMEE